MSKKQGLRLMTVWVASECPHCQSTEVTKHGKSPVDKHVSERLKESNEST